MRYTVYTDVTPLTRTEWVFLLADNRFILDYYTEQKRESTRHKTWTTAHEGNTMRLRQWSRIPRREYEKLQMAFAPQPTNHVMSQVLEKFLADAVFIDAFYSSESHFKLSPPFRLATKLGE